MSSTNRSRAKTGSASLLAALVVLSSAAMLPRAARAASSADLWFAGTALLFEDAQDRDGDLAVPLGDSGLARVLGATGATIAYQPGARYVIVTAADRRTIAFTLGDSRYTVGGVAQVAPFAPYLAGSHVYVPFFALAKALYVKPVSDGSATVLQPQLGALDVRTQGKITTVTLRGATTLRFKRTTAPGDGHVQLVFGGVSTSLDRARTIPSDALRGVSVVASGTVRNPQTTVDFDAAPETASALVPSESRTAVTLAFGPAGVALGGTPIPAQATAVASAAYGGDAGATSVSSATVPSAASPAPVSSSASDPNASDAQGANARAGDATAPAPASPVVPQANATPFVPASVTGPPASITGFKTDVGDAGLALDVAVDGDVTYEWHRLGDNRWYIDLKPAALAIPAQDVPLRDDDVPQVRFKGFVGPKDGLPTVRVAFTMNAPRAVTVAKSGDGFSFAVATTDEDPSAARSGYGRVVAGNLTNSPAPPVLAYGGPGPSGSGSIPPVGPAWKFQPPPSYNGRLIVIDPGHGGSDSGSAHNGLLEKDVTLDISRRLRTLLVSRGWVVKMTRDTDVDVYQPNDSARDELQARDDVANAAGARLFISVHINAFTSSALNGTTTYYFKPDSVDLARAVHAKLASLPTHDDGIEKANFYVIRHAKMPAILVETAFLSNPGDAAYLKQPSFLQDVALDIADGVGTYGSSQSLAPKASSDDGT